MKILDVFYLVAAILAISYLCSILSRLLYRWMLRLIRLDIAQQLIAYHLKKQ